MTKEVNSSGIISLYWNFIALSPHTIFMLHLFIGFSLNLVNVLACVSSKQREFLINRGPEFFNKLRRRSVAVDFNPVDMVPSFQSVEQARSVWRYRLSRFMRL